MDQHKRSPFAASCHKPDLFHLHATVFIFILPFYFLISTLHLLLIYFPILIYKKYAHYHAQTQRRGG